MSNWFIITSAINTEYGALITSEKFAQTIGTIDSIRHYCPDTKIVLLEGGLVELDADQIEVLRTKCDIIVPYNNNETLYLIRKISENNIQYLKSPSELFLLAEFFKTQNFIKDTDRVFKISGRYFLNSNFDLQKHNQRGKLVFVSKKPSVTYFNPEIHKIYPKLSDWQYMSRLYSFCGSLVPYMTTKYREMFEYLFLYYYKENAFTDTEHMLYGFLKEDNVIQISPIGVSGLYGDNAEMVSE
jgi:hypothetical protein